MSNQSKIILLSLMLFTVAGCSISHAVNKTLSPPADTEWVNIEVKNPSSYTKPFPLEALYISTTCKRKLMSMRDGQHYEKVGYNPVKIPLQNQSNSNLWVAKIAKNGGGKCNWQLSEFNLGIEYVDATHLGKELVPGTAVGATIAFDDNATKSGRFDLFKGSELILSPAYYPFIDSNKDISVDDTLNLFGKVNFVQKKIVSSTKNLQIKFEPTLDETKVVRMIAPTEQKIGVYYKIIYPDGTVVSDGTTHPDVKRLKD